MENNKIIIESFRYIDKWASRDIVNNYEDAFCKLSSDVKIDNIGKKQYFIKRLFRNKYFNKYSIFESLLKKIQDHFFVETDEIIFMICMNADDIEYCNFYKSKKLKIVYIIDAWENKIQYISNKINDVDIILMAYQDSINLLKQYVDENVMKKVFLFPLFINPNLYPVKPAEKKFDLIQVGRQNKKMHEWALRYSSKNKLTYLYQKRNDRGIYYFENEPWDCKNYQFSYSRLINTIAKTKIAIVSPPDSTDIKRTGRVSPLTPRYLETAMSFAVPVGLIPSGFEYKNFFPKNFTMIANSYVEFEEICDKLINNDNLREKIIFENHNFVIEKNSVETRFLELKEIINRKYN